MTVRTIGSVFLFSILLSGCASIPPGVATEPWSVVPPAELAGLRLVDQAEESRSVLFEQTGALIVQAGEETVSGEWVYLGEERELPYHIVWPTADGPRAYVATVKSQGDLFLIRGYYHAGDSLIRLFGEYSLRSK